jgi:hypothetical protein
MASTPSTGLPLIGSLCSGYGGLDLGVQAALGGTMSWHAEISPDASKILARHWPGVPNLGDISAVNWSDVPPVCVLTAGFPCQRRLGRRPSCRAPRQHPFRAVVARRPCYRGSPTVFGSDRECPGTAHLARQCRWRRGTLPVVSGRHPRSTYFAGTWCRTREPGRRTVRCAMVRAPRLRHRCPTPQGAGLPRRLARRALCSRLRPATSVRTVGHSTQRSARAGAMARIWRTKWNGCCRHRRRRTAPRAARGSGTATAT